MRILILNWRDVKNPSSGGAEILTHEVAKRLISWGHSVTQFSELFRGGRAKEEIDGVEILRQGSADLRDMKIPVHLKAFFWYKKNGIGKFDIVIDEIHGIPFFTPLYIKEKKVALICEVAGEIWNAAFGFPFNILGRLVENNYFRFYKDISFVTISPSSCDSLVGLGIARKNITILPMGISLPQAVKFYKKADVPTLIFVGRLSKTKGVEDAILALKKVRETLPNVRLWIVGRGDNKYERYLSDLVKKLNLESAITFFGYVTESRKFELLGTAHLLIVPSVKEGWGLVVGEAGINRTPAIVYNVYGLKDTVVNEKTGIITQKNQESMTSDAIRLLSDKRLYAKLQIGAEKLAKTYSWDKTAKVFLAVLESIRGQK